MHTSPRFTSPQSRPHFAAAAPRCARLASLAAWLWLLCLSLAAHAQAPDIVWQNALGGSSRDLAYAITPSGDGGFVVAGSTSSNNGDVSGNQGNEDLWVVKLDGSGNLVWQKSLGGSGFDHANAITPSDDGGFVVAGITDIDGGPSGNSAVDARIVKLDASGNLAWQKTLIGSGFDGAAGITSSGDGGFVVAGSTYSNDGDASASTDVDGAGHHGGGDFWVVKLGATTPSATPPTVSGLSASPNPVCAGHLHRHGHQRRRLQRHGPDRSRAGRGRA